VQGLPVILVRRAEEEERHKGLKIGNRIKLSVFIHRERKLTALYL
jgi:hypothetical protein